MNESNRPFFRQEAMDNQRNQWIGDALLISKIPPSIIIIVSVVFFLSFISFITIGEYSRRINVVGETISSPHPIDIFVPQDGYLVDVFVKAGTKVISGEPLLKINVDRQTEIGNVNAKKITSLNEQLRQTKETIENLKESKNETIKNITRQIEFYSNAQIKTKKSLDDAAMNLRKMKKNAEDYKKYRGMGLISKDQEYNQLYNYNQQQNVYQSLDAQYINTMSQLSNLQSDIKVKSADFDNQISQYKNQIEDLLRQLADAEAGKNIVIKAPSKGIVEAINMTKGQMIVAGESIVQIKPSDEKSTLQIVFWIPNDALPYVKIGDNVSIRYVAFPYEKFGQFSGNIQYISSVPAPAKMNSSSYQNMAATNQKNVGTYYKAIVNLNDEYISYGQKSFHLFSGMQVEMTLFLENRPLYQWMFAPFYKIKKSISGI